MKTSRWKNRNAKKIQVKERKVLQRGVGNSIWDSSGGKGQVGYSHKKCLVEVSREKKGERDYLRQKTSSELRQVASGSATQRPRLRKEQ